MFVGEAPGRLGADRTGIPLFGDQTGENFASLLGNIGWERTDVFATNAVLCNPRDCAGNNATPSVAELDNCSAYLSMTIELVDPEVIVTLGRVALQALNLITPHPYHLHSHVSKALSWASRTVLPLYHPGPRALVHRSMVQQRADYLRLSKIAHPSGGLLRRQGAIGSRRSMSDPTRMEDLITILVQVLGEVSYFRLTKLLYLADFASLQEMGATLTGAIYLRQENGPWPPSCRVALQRLEGGEIAARRSTSGEVHLRQGPAPRHVSRLAPEELALVTRVLDRYGDKDGRRLKALAYLTAPMRYLLTQEAAGRDMRRVPVLYKNLTAQQLDRSRR
jgi:uracil-DNA glycosylase family 4